MGEEALVDDANSSSASLNGTFDIFYTKFSSSAFYLYIVLIKNEELRMKKGRLKTAAILNF